MTEHEYQIALEALNRDKIVHWHPVMTGGKPLLDRLSSDFLAAPCLLTVRQQVNALMVLFRLRGWGDHQALTLPLKVASESNSLEVRDQAAKLTAGLVRLSSDESHKNERINAASLIDLLRTLLSRGVSKDTAELIRTFLPEQK